MKASVLGAPAPNSSNGSGHSSANGNNQCGTPRGAGYADSTIKKLESILVEKLKEEEEANASQVDLLLGITGSDGGVHAYSLSIADCASDRASLEAGSAAVSRLSATARDLAAALVRIRLNPGTVGVCITCGNRIPKKRMEAIPQTQVCCKCARTGGR